MRSIGLIASFLAVAAPPAFAQAPSIAPLSGDVCRDTQYAINDALKDLAALHYAETQAIGSDSAPRQTARLAQAELDIASANANLALLEAAKCPLPKYPVSSAVYADAAGECVLASAADHQAKCERANWKPGYTLGGVTYR